MEMKICPHPNCPHGQQPQPIEAFHRDKSRPAGRHTYCKDCKKVNQQRRLQSPHAQQLQKAAYDRYRNKPEARERIRQNYLSPEYREKARTYQREYRKRPDVKKKMAAATARYRERNWLKARARHTAHYTVKKGRIPIPEHCEWCGLAAPPSTLEAHHWLGYEPEHWLHLKFVHAHPCHVQCEAAEPDQWPKL